MMVRPAVIAACYLKQSEWGARSVQQTSCDWCDPAAFELPVVINGCCERIKHWQSPSVQAEAGGCQSSWPVLRRTRGLWRSWQEEAEGVIGAQRYRPSWPVASMVALIKVNGAVKGSGGADKLLCGLASILALTRTSCSWVLINERDTWDSRCLGVEPTASLLNWH